MNLLDPEDHSKVPVRLGKGKFPPTMSITSPTTTSSDWEVSSPESFHNRLCLLSITRGDGTPMDASSILEEDIVGICVQKSHTQPLGVLQYLAVESVILFGTMEDLN